MELVRGSPITEYCDRENLPTRERLELFMKVCHAVQHAHQKGVIHRDLKPSNVLVTLHDAEAVPKVTDFGVAKALGQKLTEKTLFTAFHHMIGTPAYMSPEQTGISGMDIDTRADIYSLGVLLYELLTGATPFDADALRKAGMEEIRRMIRETEPPRPSTRLHTLGDKLTEIAKHRKIEPAGLSRLVRGDLDWIVMKCLEKDRRRRYEAANGLARDIQRHLAYETVEAIPPSFIYATRKFLWRRRKEALVTALVLTAMACTIAFGLQYRRFKALRENFALSQLRREESAVLSRAIAGLALTGPEKDLTQASVSRLARRVKDGSGSQGDHELLARFLTREVRLGGRFVQIIDHPSITLQASPGGGYAVDGVAAVLRPMIALDGDRGYGG